MISRREFLKAGLAVAASAALPGLPDVGDGIALESVSSKAAANSLISTVPAAYDCGASVALTATEWQEICALPSSSTGFVDVLGRRLEKPNFPDIESLYS